MGAKSLNEFAVALMTGIVCGAYSSVCITGPVWYLFKRKGVKKAEEAAKAKLERQAEAKAKAKAGKEAQSAAKPSASAKKSSSKKKGGKKKRK